MFLNKVQIIARLTHTPEVSTTSNGTKKARLTLANNTKWRDQQGNTHEQAYYYEAICWSGIAGVVEKYAIKGQELYIEGKLTTDKYEGRDGTTKYRTYILVDNLQLGQKPAGADNRQTAAEKNFDSKQEEIIEVEPEDGEEIRVENIPF